MPQRSQRTVIPSPPQSGIDGIIEVQHQIGAVLTGLQESMGRTVTSVAVIEEALKEHNRRVEELHRITRGENGKNSLVVRVARLEQSQQMMLDDFKEHRLQVEADIKAIRAYAEGQEKEAKRTAEERGKEDRSRRLSIQLLIATLAASAFWGIISTIVALFKH